MFTGIVQELGTLRRIGGGEVEIETSRSIAVRLTAGASIAVNGTCLTVRTFDTDAFRADLSPETVRRTTFATLRPPARVNLETAVRADQSLDGHLVLGHVDAVGRIQALYREGGGWILIISYPSAFCRYVAEKGSIAVDGISLTPYSVEGNGFRCSVVPETYAKTTLQDRSSGDPVNLEFDVLAKYVERTARFVHHD
jgi:riboflavin synthase